MDNNENEKLSFDSLVFEITRKCNLKCEHCMCGEPEDITMSKEIINKTIGQIDRVKKIFLTGGEPMLEPDTVDYLVKNIIEKNIKLLAFNCVSNGTILNENGIKFINSLNEIATYINKCYRKDWEEDHNHHIVNLTISTDEFHHNNPDKAIKFYKKYANNLIHIIREDEDENINNRPTIIKNSGRAEINNIGIGCTHFINNMYHKECCGSCHRIEFEQNQMVKCPILICANGNTRILEDISFEYRDKYNMGNILNKSLIEMINEWQWKEPLLCKEIIRLIKLEGIRNHPECNSENDKKMIEYIQYFMMLKREGMQEVHELFPDLDYDDVVNATNAMLNVKTQGNFSMVLGTVFPEYKNYVFDSERENEIWERLRNKQWMKGMSRLLKWLIN